VCKIIFIINISIFINERKGRKLSGARVISFVKIIDKTVYLLSIYNKGEKDTMTDNEIEKLLEGYL